MKPAAGLFPANRVIAGWDEGRIEEDDEMPSRADDWYRQARRDLQHARHALEDEEFEWACFAAQRAAVALARRRPEVERIILFGSLATGRAVPGSDADLLVILAHSDQPFLARIPLYIPEGVGIGVDVFPYIQGELEEMQAAGNHFLKRALAEGMDIFPSPSSGNSPT
jgi:predicted nucleotidyltransferase